MNILHKRRTSRGFTLTELAIVVGIIGAVAAGIFMAASAAEYRLSLNQGLDEISLIVGNMRSLYASQNASAVPTQAFATVTPTLISQGVFPSEMLNSAKTAAYNPWDHVTAGGSALIQIVAAGANSSSQFAVRYLTIPYDVCADLLVRNSLTGPDTGLQKINVNGAAVAALPVTPLAAAKACPSGTTYTIDWYYSLGS